MTITIVNTHEVSFGTLQSKKFSGKGIKDEPFRTLDVIEEVRYQFLLFNICQRTTK